MNFNDSFDVFLRGGCGSVPTAYRGAITFVDSRPGVPGNDESNDDYVRIQDLCENGHGVKGWAWRNGKLLGSKYNGKGAFKPVIWDPYTRKKGTNVKEDDYVGIKICEVDGSGDSRPGPCDQDSRYSVDG
jgi:hypothetical protein